MRLTARCTRSGDGWNVEVPEIRGLTTTARRLSQVRPKVIDAALLLTQTSERGAFQVTLEPVLSPDEAELVEAAMAARRDVARAEYQATLATMAAADRLRALGMTSVEVATVLGVDPKTIFELGT